MTLKTAHLEELKASGIADSVISANFESIEGQYAVDLMLPHKDWQRRNDLRLIDKDLKLYETFANGGWYAAGTFKPDSPRCYFDKTKGREEVIKYETIHGEPTGIYQLNVPPRLARKIAARHKLKSTWLKAESKGVPFWDWVKTVSIPIIITEGIKKTASLLSAGYAVIGLPGIYNGYRTPKDEYGNPLLADKYLHPELEKFCQKEREIVFCFDNDSKPETRKNVRTAIINTGYLIQPKGCQVKVMTWDLPFKGIDDLIVAQGKQVLSSIYSNRNPLDIYKLDQYFDLSEYIRLRVNTPNLLDAIKDIPDARLISIKSPKGSSKTEWLAQMITPFWMAGGKVIVPVHREQLAKELARRLGIDYRTERSDTGRIFGYSLCVDSLHPKANPSFNPECWQECWVIMDEADQVAWHTLDSDTCKYNRASILESLGALLNIADKIFLASADLNKACIDWINGMLATPHTPFVILNEYQRESLRDCFTYDKPEDCYTILTKNLRAGQKALIHTGGQQNKSKWGTRNLERQLKHEFPDKKILRLDRQSIAQPDHPGYDCISNLNAVIADYDVVVMSPVIETGVSITCPGFDAVYCFATGSQTVDAVGQSVERYRLPVPRHIYAAKSAGFNLIGNGSTDPLSLMKGQKALAEAQKALLDADQYSDFELGIQSIHLKTWAIFAAHHNIGYRHYRDSIHRLLQQNGFNIQAVELDEETLDLSLSLKEDICKSAEMGHEKYCQAVASAEIITDDREYIKLKDKRTKTEAEQLTEKASTLSRRYATDDLTPELVNQDSQQGWHSQIELKYYLTVGREYLPERDKQRVRKLAESNGKVFESDLNRACLGVKIWVLEETGFRDLLDGDRTFCQDDPDLIQWHRRVCGWAPQIKDALGIKVNSNPKAKNNGPISVLKRFMGKVGLELEQVDRKTTGSKAGIYKLKSINPDGRFEIFDRWVERDKSRECVELISGIPETVTSFDISSFEALFSECVEGISNISQDPSHTPQLPSPPSDQEGEEYKTIEPISGSSLSEAVKPLKLPFPFKVGDLVKGVFWDYSVFRDQAIEGKVTEIRQNYWLRVAGRLVPFSNMELLASPP